MQLDCAAQRLLIIALRNQIKAWREQSNSERLSEEDKADIDNDIGYAFTILSEMEASFFKQFNHEPN